MTFVDVVMLGTRTQISAVCADAEYEAT